MAATKKTATPFAEVHRLIGSVTNDELLKVIDVAFDEAVTRTENYADLLFDESSDPPRDALNEGLAFAVRLDERIGPWRFEWVRRARIALSELKDGLDG